MKWQYTYQKDNQSTTITGISFREVFRKAKKHFIEINVNFDSDSLKNQIYEQNKKESPKSNVVQKVSIKDSIQGAKALLAYASGKSVSNQEILRRANLCAACPKVSNVSDCMGCGGSGRIATLINTIRQGKGREVQIPDGVKRKFCGVCSCSIPLLIVTKFEDFKKDSHERPTHCWMNPSSPQFSRE